MVNPDLRPATDMAIAQHPYPLLFATISGAHLYGFESPDSDVDMRGVHRLPLPEIVGLEAPHETVERMAILEGREIDLVTHDARKFFTLLLRRNGYVLEQLLSPLVVRGGPHYDELVALAPGCITRHHAHHYMGFAATQKKLFLKENPPRVKPLLYVYRVLRTGLHLMQTGTIEANLAVLDAAAPLPGVADLIARKRAGVEKEKLDPKEVDVHIAATDALLAQLEAAYDACTLPDMPTARPALHDLLVRIRLGEAQGAGDPVI